MMIYNRFVHYCETLGTTRLRKLQENVNESWRNPSSDGESQISQLIQEKCPTTVLRKFLKHESVNLIRLKQTAKLNTLQEVQNEKTSEAIKKAEKEFSMDLPLLVDETARDTKILDAIIALETGRSDNIFYPYDPHREYLTTRFGLLFYNDKIIISEELRSTLIAMLLQGHVTVNKMDQSAEPF